MAPLPHLSLPAFFAMALLCLSATGLGAAEKRKEKEKDAPVLAPAPPQPVPQQIRVLRGEKVEIPLRIYGLHKETLRFPIRTQPRHGKLSGQKAVDRYSGAIVYEPPTDLAIVQDSFQYAAQSSAGVSAPASVEITIVDHPAQFIPPAALDFAPVLAGETSAAELVLENRGGGIVEGEILCPAPWKVSGSARYRLPAGQKQTFTVVFAPTAGGEMQGDLTYSSHRERATQLKASALARVAAEPAQVTLGWDEEKRLHRGTVQILNRTEKAMAFQASGLERIHGPTTVEAAANDRTTVEVATHAGQIAEVREELVLDDGAGTVVRATIVAPAAPARLALEPAMLDFGTVAPEAAKTVVVHAQNVGGKAGRWRIQTPDGITSPAPELALEAGQRLPVGFVFTAPTVGARKAMISFQDERGASALEVKANVTAAMPAWGAGAGGAATATAAAQPERVMLPNVATAAGAPSQGREPGPDEPRRVAVLPSVAAREAAAAAQAGREGRGRRVEHIAGTDLPLDTALLRTVPGLRVASVKQTKVVLEWKRIAEATSYGFQERVVGLDARKELAISWKTLKNAATRVEGERVVAELGQLQPGTAYRIKIFPNKGASPFSIGFRTRPTTTWAQVLNPTRIALGVAVVIAAGLVWVKVRKRRGG